MRLIYYFLLFIFFYLVWKIIKSYFITLNSQQKTNPNVESDRDSSSKYKDIEEAKFTEIKDENKENKN